MAPRASSTSPRCRAPLQRCRRDLRRGRAGELGPFAAKRHVSDRAQLFTSLLTFEFRGASSSICASIESRWFSKLLPTSLIARLIAVEDGELGRAFDKSSSTSTDVLTALAKAASSSTCGVRYRPHMPQAESSGTALSDPSVDGRYAEGCEPLLVDGTSKTPPMSTAVAATSCRSAASTNALRAASAVAEFRSRVSDSSRLRSRSLDRV